MSSSIVIGRNCVYELLLHRPRSISEIFLSKKLQEGNDTRISALQSLARKEGIPLVFVPKDKLLHLAQSSSHQGVLAFLSSPLFWDLKTLIEAVEGETSSCLLALDSIEDPQNFGSILRTAECYGVKAVLWSKHRGLAITPLVAKVSMGASHFLPLVRVSNLSQNLSRLQEEGFSLIATDVEGDLWTPEIKIPRKAVFMLGSEAKGLRPLLLKQADLRLRLPLKGRITSLNVAQASAACLALWSFHS